MLVSHKDSLRMPLPHTRTLFDVKVLSVCMMAPPPVEMLFSQGKRVLQDMLLIFSSSLFSSFYNVSLIRLFNSRAIFHIQHVPVFFLATMNHTFYLFIFLKFKWALNFHDVKSRFAKQMHRNPISKVWHAVRNSLICVRTVYIVGFYNLVPKSKFNIFVQSS